MLFLWFLAPCAWLDSGTCSLASVLVTSGLVVFVSRPPFHVLALAGWRSVHRCRFGSLSARAVALGLGLTCFLFLVYGWYVSVATQNGEVCTVDGSLPLHPLHAWSLDLTSTSPWYTAVTCWSLSGCLLLVHTQPVFWALHQLELPGRGQCTGTGPM